MIQNRSFRPCVSLTLTLFAIVGCCTAEASFIRVVDETNGATLSVRRRSKRHHESVRVEIDSNDLFNMPSFIFTGQNLVVGASSRNATSRETAVYVKTHSTRRTTNGGTDSVVTWHGMIAESGCVGFATLLRSSDSSGVVATVSTATTVYDIGMLPNGTQTVQLRLWKNVLDGEGYDLGETDSLLLTSPRTKKSSDAAVLQAVGVVQPDTNGTVATSLGKHQAVAISSMNRRSLSNNVFDRTTMRSATSNNHVVDILVLVTNRALCEVAGARGACVYSETTARPIQDKIALALEQTNAAMRAADIPVTIRLVEIIYLQWTFDANPDVAALEILRTNVQVKQWINEAGADLVTLLTGSLPSGFDAAGTAYIDRPESVVCVDYLASYTFTHEIGHNFGCRHNRGACPSSHPYGHALQVRNQFRTVMAYQCDTSDSCPRIPFYSASGYLYNGIPMGDASQDNARLIREKAARVASFKAAPLSVSSAPILSPPVRIPAKVPSRRTIPAPAPVPTPVRVPVPVRVPAPAPKKRPLNAPARRPTQRPIIPVNRPTRPQNRPTEPPQQAIIPVLTCGPEINVTTVKCPGKNLMNAITPSTLVCTESCVAESFVAFWTRLGRNCGPCVA